MRIFAIGDLHLAQACHKPMDIFGAAWENHTALLVDNWMKTIKDEDVILIPGDISWAMRLNQAKADLDILERLPGKKICIRGNHDYWWDRPGKLNVSYHTLYFLQNKSYCIDKLAVCGTRGWICPDGLEWSEEDEKILNRELMRLKLSLDDALNSKAEEIILMMHYPPAALGEKTSSFISLLEKYPVTYVVYGHLHDKLSWQKAVQGNIKGVMYQLVSADYLKFSPLLIRT